MRLGQRSNWKLSLSLICGLRLQTHLGRTMRTAAGFELRVRRAVRVRGTVQGVGFRPTVCRLATDLALGGFVRNDDEGVSIEIEGGPGAVVRFVTELSAAAPAPARIESVETAPLPALGDETFRIVPSAPAGARTLASIPADLAPCADCLRELRDPGDRRFRYPFINCTACGPRFTIVRSIPYDRPRTTMDAFTLCVACRAEYDDPRNRRFHAEPNACPLCGPTVTLSAPHGPEKTGDAALRAACGMLARGSILAIKGVGGFVLAVDARDAVAVARLRTRKQRPAKPFAVMAGCLQELERVVVLDEVSRRALTSQARPIVLAPVRAGCGLAANVAPGLRELGVYLPASPLQQLLLDDGPSLLVMTSGNRAEEPIAAENAEARRELAAVADGFLLHDREIHARADDSVVRIVAGEASVIRRARGYVPEPIRLPFDAPPVLGVGAELKGTVCLTRGGEAILSQHLGDLHDAQTYAFFCETIGKLQELAGTAPVVVAHDLHPDYRSTRWARAWAGARGIPCRKVQHHHAHVASCLVENGRTGPVLGVVFDGTGLGTDGSLWGGEFLAADLSGFERLGHLRPIALLGGEAAIRQPWRLAAAALLDAGTPAQDLLDAVGAHRAAIAREVWDRPRLAPPASGAGRWFDAVAALCGVRAEVTYDGQAAIELEAVADDEPAEPYAFGFESSPDAPFVADLRPMVRAVADDLRGGAATGMVSARFHATMAEVVVAACARARRSGAPETVALSGGCFQNRRLTEAAKAGLERLGFEVLLSRRVPCNDGGLALGQAAVVAFSDARDWSKKKAGRACA
jgi:hydrogenase maturation protein HypF